MSSPLVLIAGTNRLSAAIEERLRGGGATIGRISEDPAALTAAALEGAAALVIAAHDDAGNVDMALTTRRLRPELPLVIRLFDPTLTAYVRSTLAGAEILSMSSVAAPVLADETLRALARGATGSAGGGHRGVGRARRRAQPFWQRLDRVVVGAFLTLATVMTTATIFFARTMGLRPLDALYFVWTTVLTVGYGDITLRAAPDSAKLVGMGLMLVGAAFLAVLFAFFTSWVMRRRVDVLKGRVQVRWRGHVVIAGGGHMAIGVAELLAAAGRRVVVIEREEDRPHIAMLRAARHRVIIADATNEDVLDLAGVGRAAALVALTDADPTNLHIALLAKARAQGGGLAVVMRAESAELSAYVNEHKDAVAVSSIAVTADVFADRALSAARGGKQGRERRSVA
jgi:Trk K+ transport system NAD-binding subunit